MLIGLLIVAILHLMFTIIGALSIGRWRSNQNNSTPSISIIIAARNEFNNLQKLIPELLSQDYPAYEIIVALDRCTDESSSYLTGIRDGRLQIVEITEIPSSWNPKKYALTAAVNKAKHDWLSFTDADCMPKSDQWLTSISHEITPNVDMVIGISPYAAEKTLLAWYIQFEAFLTSFLYSSMTLIGRPYMAVGRNFSIRRSFFHAVNGYEPIKSITGGDDDLFVQVHATNANAQLMMGTQSLVITQPERTWKSYFQQKKRHFSVSKHYQSSHQTILTLYHLTHLLCLFLIFSSLKTSYFVPIILFYLFIKLGSYRFATSKIGSGFNYMLFPIVDSMYALLTPVLSIWSKLVKDIKWKN